MLDKGEPPADGTGGVPGSHRTNNADALRIVLALTVVYSHSYPLATGVDGDPLMWASGGRINLGTLAVAGFFALSGYLIAQSCDRTRSALAYLRKRVARIYPGYLVAVLFCLYVAVPLLMDSPRWREVYSPRLLIRDNSWRFATLNGFFSPPTAASLPYPGAVNGALWSVQVEFGCYLIALAATSLAVLSGRRAGIALLAATMALSGYMELTGAKPKVPGRYLGLLIGSDLSVWARMSAIFLGGLAAYRWRDRIAYRAPFAALAAILLLAGLRMPHGAGLVLPTAGVYLTLYFAFTKDFRVQLPPGLGDPSYGIYLYGFPIQQLIVHAIGHVTSPWLLFVLSAPTSFLAGMASWWLVERWFLPGRAAATKAVEAPSSPSPVAGGGHPVLEKGREAR